MILTDIQAVKKSFIPSWETCENVAQLMDQEIVKCMKDGNRKKSLKMINSHVFTAPTLKESGDYLALDLGGTNFRVSLIKLNQGEYEAIHQIYDIPNGIKQSTGQQLFQHIAECLQKFIATNNLGDKKYFLGFTFSFPVELKSISEGIIIAWTKSYKIPDAIGKDVNTFLTIEMKKLNINVECCAIINDTVGCLMSSAFKYANARIGVILGTGTNACYFENLEKFKKWTKPQNNKHNKVAINMEWGSFGENGIIDFLRTPIDMELDKNSINPGENVYEKMISGMYLGDIVHKIINSFIESNNIFGGKLAPQLKEYHFDSRVLSVFATEDDDKIGKLINKWGYMDYSKSDVEILTELCDIISRRAAYLAAAGITCLLRRVEEKDVTVGIDGSLYRFHPHFKSYIIEGIDALLKNSKKYQLELSVDGSCTGASIVAAMSSHFINQ